MSATTQDTKILSELFLAMINNPSEDKYKSINVPNLRAILQNDGWCMEIMQALGFRYNDTKSRMIFSYNCHITSFEFNQRLSQHLNSKFDCCQQNGLLCLATKAYCIVCYKLYMFLQNNFVFFFSYKIN